MITCFKIRAKLYEKGKNGKQHTDYGNEIIYFIEKNSENLIRINILIN